MRRSYRKQFIGAVTPAQYDLVEYAPNSVSNLMWQVESKILLKIVTEMRQKHGRINYLDFACGTGRIIQLIEDKVDSSTGIDISPTMVSRAAKKLRSTKLLCIDITSQNVPVEAHYDLITAFRFFTNAEPSLRRDSIRQLALRLRGLDSILIINAHGNPFSYRAFLLWWYWLRSVISNQELKGYITNRQMLRLIKEAGLISDHVIGTGFIPGQLLKYVPWRLAQWIEHKLAGMPVIHKFGVNQIFICRLQTSV